MPTPMRCPQCNKRLRQMTDGSGRSYCAKCGWMQRDESADAHDSTLEPSAGLFVKLVIAWLFSAALVLGPYVALLIYVPQVEFWMHLTYWLVMFIYLAAAATTTPRYDSDNLGLAGGMIDNPLSYEDDMNRMGLVFAIVLIPGKIFAWSIKVTWKLAFG